jgi:GNAT superfamily N-acetyltransferase
VTSAVVDPVVRVAGPDDHVELRRLLAAAKDELADRKGAWLWERSDARFASIDAAVDGCLTAPYVCLVACIDDVVVGCVIGVVTALHEGGDVGVVHGLYVDAEAREVGVGDLLLLEVMERFRAAGCVGVDAWALPGERETKNFYEAHGFSARAITVHHSFIEPKHTSRTAMIRAQQAESSSEADPA